MSGSASHTAEVIDAVERFVWSFPEIDGRRRERHWTDRLMTGRRPPRASARRANPRQYPRTARLNQLLREILADALEHIDDDRLELLTITAVEVDPDLRQAVVYYDSLQGEDGDAEVLEALGELRTRLQAAIGREARVKRTPELSFRARPGGARGRPASRVPPGRDRAEGRRRSRSIRTSTTILACPANRDRSSRPMAPRSDRGVVAPTSSSATGWPWSTRRPGWTSHDVVAKARGILHNKKIGHSGTLDPDATGVLLLGVGRATRLLRFLTALPKPYVGEIVLGAETTTLDARARWWPPTTWPASRSTRSGPRRQALTGDILQVPPMVSAVKVGGRRLHELAREGVEVERRAPRR